MYACAGNNSVHVWSSKYTSVTKIFFILTFEDPARGIDDSPLSIGVGTGGARAPQDFVKAIPTNHV